MFLPLIKYSVIKCLLNKWSLFIAMLDVEESWEIDLPNSWVMPLWCPPNRFQLCHNIDPLSFQGTEQGPEQMDSSASSLFCIPQLVVQR